MKAWSTIPEDLRNKVDGILDLKMPFTAEDLALFPKLKVLVVTLPPLPAADELILASFAWE